ncbi:winged helix-turn-helix transcriptional regulator [Furfurilactobacillus curtus]|uniref:HxlR family transcriptional regulator n=1 Tax=Furfurilactobacillus curtus TaxID=1746200 RepID=A0ABQ5JKX3_9LACO
MSNEFKDCLLPAELSQTGFSYTLSEISGKYKIEILYLLSIQGTRRFNEIKRTMGAISFKSLTNALQGLTNDHLITRHQFPEIPPHVEYQLSSRGKSLLPVLDAICLWGESHQPSAE